MKVHGFLKDIGGAGRVTRRRRAAIQNAGSQIVTRDPIHETALSLHPRTIALRVAGIRETSPTARTFRLAPEGPPLPVFQAGQYLSMDFQIGKTITTRPYSISSAPFEARGANPFVEITVRKKGSTFVPDYLFDHIKAGDVLTGSMPHGQFFYEPLRDSENVVALAGGSGITPFYSMAREIAYGKLDFRLTILYGSANADDIIFRNELNALECPKIHTVHVLSEDPDWKGEKGFLTAELIKKYSEGDTTYLVCGPQAMYRFVEKELKALQIPRRRIRREVFGTPKEIAKYPGFPDAAIGKTFQLTVRRGIHEDTIPASSGEPVAISLERAGIPIGTHCRSGECGFCRSQLLSGNLFVCPDGDGRRKMDREWGWFHPCASYPVSDLTIKIPIL